MHQNIPKHTQNTHHGAIQGIFSEQNHAKQVQREPHPLRADPAHTRPVQLKGGGEVGRGKRLIAAYSYL